MEPCTCELDTDVIKKLNKDPSLISEHRDQSFKIIQFVENRKSIQTQSPDHQENQTVQFYRTAQEARRSVEGLGE